MSIVPSIARPTIMDVARKCGLSKTTVSIILNKAAGSARVPSETQDRVRAAALELGYQPSWRATALSRQRTHNIGVLYAPPMRLVLRGNYEGIMAGFNEVVHERGYHLLLVPLGDEPAGWGRILLDQRMDGCLVLSRLREPLGELVSQSRLPVALVNAETDRPLPQVIADEFDGALQNTRHLLELGHRRIGFFMGQQPPHFSVTRRQEGYMAAMLEAGLAEQVAVIGGELEAFVDLLASDPQRPTAVLVYNHYLAVKLLQLLWEAGLRVPQDLSVTTFADAYPVEDVIPPLTTMALPTEQMGRESARIIIEQIENGQDDAPPKVVLKQELIIRRSTAAPGA
jgi:LacI family transcriptional regulator